MRVRDLVHETGDAIVQNRVRSALTILGIVIGIGAVIAITSLIDGMKMQIVNQMGLNMARVVRINLWKNSGPVTLDDIHSIGQDLSSDYDFITGYTNAYVQEISSQTAKLSDQDYAQTVGCEPDYFTVMGYEPTQGRYFTAEENDEGKMVAVINSFVAEKLFGGRDKGVGQQIRLGNDRYTVVGIFDTGSTYGDYGMICIPAQTAITRLIGQSAYQDWYMLGFAREGSDMYAVAQNTKNYLSSKYGIELDENGNSTGDTGSLDVYTAQQQIDQLDQTMGSFRLMALAVAGVSLLVGGIGIMNMMLTNVTERIREIGLRKSLGARRHDITMQFLLESITLCILGGIFGIAVGYGGAWALAGVVGSSMGYKNLVPVITPETVGAATAVCVGIGVLFGYYPARRAAKLDPIESLRYQ